MDFKQLIQHYKLLDIITVDDTHYALSRTALVIPGCTVILDTQLQSYLFLFLAKGHSQKNNMPYSKFCGVESWIMFTYSLENLPATRKQIFNHTISGTKQRNSLLSSWNGQKIGRCAFFVPKEYEQDVIAFFNQWAVQYTTEVVFRGN